MREEDFTMKIFVLASLGVLALFAPAAHADTVVKSHDGAMEMTLPNGWHELSPEGTAALIVAVDGHGARVAVHSFSKEDFKDMKSVAGFSASRLKLVENPEQNFQNVDVNGKPAVRVQFTGTEPNGMRRGFLITVFEAGAQYIEVVASSNASAFSKDAPILETLAKQIVVGSNSAAPPAAPAAGSPKPQPPARH
jgi:hypothetical protein